MIDTIFKHRSIRKYKSTPVEDDKLQIILKSAIRASNTGNMQVYSIIVTKEESLRQQLWEAHFKQDMVKQAPVILTFVADINRFEKWCKLRDAEPAYNNFLWFYNATIDAVIAAQNAALQAEELGLGICYLGTTTYMADKISQILQLPQGVVPVTTITVGYPDETPPLTERLPDEAVIHYEKYKDYSNEDIDKYYKEKENLESSKKFVEESGVDNLAKVFTEKRYVKEDNLYFSEQFKNLVKKQGFNL